ncbi:MAG TPA: sarcosine oxidase subunit delta [Candidatus Binatia bacterium]|jgi:heterotetrameric sarcosine oxidase delta subunit|nr:sarcosine oxidase subunit delta [Candidatus Binatia bacterium]
MMLVPCPFCGPRDASEFRWVGEAHRRPAVAEATPPEWRAYLYLRRNVAGWSVETWYHRAGCRRYFRAERHTVTNAFRAAQAPGAVDAPGREVA